MLANPAGAAVLENWFPTQQGIRLRGGSYRMATIGAEPVEALFSYVTAGTKRFFAADEENIFDVTSVADPDIPPDAVVTGQSSGDYSTEMMTTDGGEYLVAVNTADDPQLFNGTTWQAMDAGSDPALDGATGLAHIWKYRSRLFFTNNTMSFYYLATNAIGGTLAEYNLAGIFLRGGALLCGATWSLDSGDGIDDKCVFLTTEGEVAVYEGGDPSNIASWSLVGRYDIGRPLGKNALMSVGGDLLISTEDGIVPISRAIQKDPSELSLAAITRAIEPVWKKDAVQRQFAPWSLMKWTAKNMAVVGLPNDATTTPYCFVVNLETGAWAKFTGWDTRSLGLFNGLAFFGTNDGRIMQCERGGTDDGAMYISTYINLFDHLNVIGAYKTVHMARAIFLAAREFIPRLTVSTDYTINLPTPPQAAAPSGEPAIWDVSKWDQAKWDGEDANAPKRISMKWSSVGRSGISIGPQIQVSNQADITPDAELVGMDLIFDVGGIVV